MKGSADVATMNERRMTNYALVCGETLAQAHARSADPIAVSGYLGSGKVFVDEVTEFGFKYADQNDRDDEAFVDAIHSGKVAAEQD